MNLTHNLSYHLSVYQRPGENMTSVDGTIELFIVFTHYMWYVFGPMLCIVNLSVFIVVFKVNRSQKIYYLMQVNSIYKAVTGGIYTFTFNTACLYCKSNFYNSLYVLIYKTYFIVVLNDILTLTVGLTEIIIAFDRLCILKNNSANFFARQNIKWVLPFVFAMSIVVFSPDFFIVDIIRIDEGVYYREINAFGTSNYYNYVFVAIRIIASVAVMITYLKLVISLLVAYNEFLERKKRIRKKNERVNKNDRDLTKLVMFQGLCNLATLFIATASRQLGRIGVKIKDENPTDYYVGWLILLEGSTQFLCLCALNISDMAIFVYDSRIKLLFKSETERKKATPRV